MKKEKQWILFRNETILKLEEKRRREEGRFV